MSMENKKDEAVEAETPEAANGKDQAPEEPVGEPPEVAEVTEEIAEEATAEERIAELEQRVLVYKDQLLRAVAETDNLRKRNERQLEDAHKYAISSFAKELLNVSDNLRRAIEAAPSAESADDELLKTLRAGVQAVERDLLAAFEKHGVVKITPLHDRFDPNFHQAMFEVPDTGKPPGTIVQLLQPGYLLRDRLLRPAMVGIAKGARPEEKKVDTTV